MMIQLGFQLEKLTNMNVKDIKTTSTSCTDWEKLDQMTDEEID